MEVQRISSGTPWEDRVGYVRAVRAGPVVAVSGTTATTEDGEIAAPGDAYAQAARAVANVRRALAEAGADLSDVIRTRVFVTDIERWEEVGRAHAEAFGEHPPATSMVEVSRLVHPDMLVEIEAEAWVGEA